MTELVAALQAESAAIRWRAIEHLNRAEHLWLTDETLALLIKALADQHPFVRWQAGLAVVRHAEGTRKLADFLNNSSVKNSPQTTRGYSAAIDALGASQLSDTYPSLLAMLGVDDALLRQSAAEALAHLRTPAAVPALIKALDDADPWVRRAAAYALGHIGDTQAIPALITRLQDKHVIVRRSAVYALGALRAASALPQLKISLTDQDQVTRRNAVWAIGRLGLPETVPDLTKVRNDPSADPEIKATAGQAIEAITKPGWLQTLLGVKGRWRR